MPKGLAFVLSGPSGSGKDTVLARVRERMPELGFSISCVTRPKRGSDREDGKYRFITVEEFESMMQENAFLEHNVFLGNYYGTPRKPVEEALARGEDIVIEIDVNGAAQIRRSLPEAVSLFILPPSMEVLRARLLGRSTDTPEAAGRRLNEAIREIGCAKDYDYVIVNDDLDRAVEDVCSVIRAARLRSDSMKEIINEVLEHA